MDNLKRVHIVHYMFTLLLLLQLPLPLLIILNEYMYVSCTTGIGLLYLPASSYLISKRLKYNREKSAVCISTYTSHAFRTATMSPTGLATLWASRDQSCGRFLPTDGKLMRVPESASHTKTRATSCGSSLSFYFMNVCFF